MNDSQSLGECPYCYILSHTATQFMNGLVREFDSMNELVSFSHAHLARYIACSRAINFIDDDPLAISISLVVSHALSFLERLLLQLALIYYL